MTPREHRLLPHTADTGLLARGPDLATTFEEAAYALAGLVADIAPEALVELEGDALPPLGAVRLAARDLGALAFAWLDELVGRVDLDGALAAVEVEAVEVEGVEVEAVEVEGSPTPIARVNAGPPRRPSPGDSWRLRARVATLPFDGERVRRRADVKAVTFHGLEVVPDPDGGWRLTAYLDV